jgi:integrase
LDRHQRGTRSRVSASHCSATLRPHDCSGTPGAPAPILAPFWSTKTKTAKDLRGRISKVVGWAANEGYRADGPNPAAWESNLEFALAKPSKIRKAERHEPLPVIDVVGFMVKLRAVDTMTARMLEFAILNASRAGEVRFAHWCEIDLEKRTWTIPAKRMKTRHHDWAADHVVPLSDAALSLLLAIRGNRSSDSSDYVFAGHAGLPLAKTGMRHLLAKVDRGSDVHVSWILRHLRQLGGRRNLDRRGDEGVLFGSCET